MALALRENLIPQPANNTLSLVGAIEGFYGKSWSWEDRFSYAYHLREMGLGCYIYAPKGDPFLRKRWREEWPEQEWLELLKLSSQYRYRHINWGLGISPYALYTDYSNQQKRLLKAKVRRLNDLNPDVLAVLFDDMPGDMPDLAARQYEIVSDICQETDASRVIVCPTYYSFDPVLEQIFGKMPENYWRQLGRLLPQDIDIFWTGNKVCSASINSDDLSQISDSFGRLPVLWDNYPVNDGRAGCNFLNLRSLPERNIKLGSDINGHLCNPMSQANLSLIPLSSLACLHNTERSQNEFLLSQALDRYAGTITAALLEKDISAFQELGLLEFDDEQRELLMKRYSNVPGACAAEICSWLRGDYTFDPECLTG